MFKIHFFSQEFLRCSFENKKICVKRKNGTVPQKKNCEFQLCIHRYQFTDSQTSRSILIGYGPTNGLKRKNIHFKEINF